MTTHVTENWQNRFFSKSIWSFLKTCYITNDIAYRYREENGREEKWKEKTNYKTIEWKVQKTNYLHSNHFFSLKYKKPQTVKNKK